MLSNSIEDVSTIIGLIAFVPLFKATVACSSSSSPAASLFPWALRTHCVNVICVEGLHCRLAIDLLAIRTSTQIVVGKAYAANYAAPTPNNLRIAVMDMEAAYNNAKSRPNKDAARINLKTGALGGLTLTPGVYTFGTGIVIAGDVTFQGSGSSSDVFIIQTTGAVTMAAGTKIILANGVQAKNIFWQVAGNVAVGAGALMQGILLVKKDVLFATGSALNGSVLTQTACNLQSAVITKQ